MRDKYYYGIPECTELYGLYNLIESGYSMHSLNWKSLNLMSKKERIVITTLCSSLETQIKIR